MAKAYFSRMTVLNGIVIRSTVDSGIIDTIKLPQLGNRFLTVEAKDIQGDNRVKVANDFIPLLTSTQITYKGQPILALFGFDSESVQLKAKQIDISYRLAEAEPKEDTSVPFSREYGNFDTAVTAPDLKSLTQTYDYARLHSPSYYITRIMAGMDSGMLHVIAPTQWMFHMRDAISDITLIPKKKIVIHRMPFFAPNDEMLLNPSILAAIAAVASIKGNYPVEIQDSYPVFRPAMHIERKSYFMSDGKPVAEEVKAVVDQGAYPLFSGEMAVQMSAGFYPPCELKGMKISIDFKESEQSPANFYGDLGYSEALASTEAQYNQIAPLTGQNPDTWKVQYYNASPNHDKLVTCFSFQKMKETLKAISAKSDFPRKYDAYETLRQKTGKYSSFFGYARGIACAVGPGIAGFSKDARDITPLSVQLQLDPGDKVKMNTSFYTNGNSAGICKKLIVEKLGVKESDIIFPSDMDEMVDSGPSVLASNSGRMPLLVEKTCDLIKEKRFVNPLPICESVTGFRDVEKGENEFTSNSWVTMVLELYVDTITFQPVVRHLWVAVLTGRLFNMQVYLEKIRHTAITTLQENGAIIAHSKELTVDVTVEQANNEISSSVTSTVRSMALATFSSALGQALGSSEFALPVSSEMIMKAMTRRKS